jgi:hypothetical protein
MMRRHLSVVLGVLAALFGCNSKAFNESFCASYKDSFVRNCTDACAKSAPRDSCAPRCVEALPKDPTFAAKCGNGAAAK